MEINCDVYIFDASRGSCYHQHMQWNESTGESHDNHVTVTCDVTPYTTGWWRPLKRLECLSRVFSPSVKTRGEKYPQCNTEVYGGCLSACSVWLGLHSTWWSMYQDRFWRIQHCLEWNPARERSANTAYLFLTHLWEQEFKVGYFHFRGWNSSQWVGGVVWSACWSVWSAPLPIMYGVYC